MQKGIAIQKELKGYSVEYRGLSMEGIEYGGYVE